MPEHRQTNYESKQDTMFLKKIDLQNNMHKEVKTGDISLVALLDTKNKANAMTHD